MSQPLFPEFTASPQYPHAAGWKKRATSKAAAVAITPRVGSLRAQVLAEIKLRPSTADEVAQRLGRTELAIRPRLSELLKLEPAMIADSGERRKNASGKTAIVWVAR
jgi:hypothetical protein